MKKGYFVVLVFSLFNAVGRTLYYRIYIKKDYYDIPSAEILLRIIILFLAFFIPGVLLVRWYYRQKSKSGNVAFEATERSDNDLDQQRHIEEP